MLLGTLVHRAVLWAFLEPVHGPQLWRMTGPDVLRTIVLNNVRVLTRAMRSIEQPLPGDVITTDLFGALVDRTGAVTSTAAARFMGLNGVDRGWVGQKLAGAATRAAEALCEDFHLRRYLTVRSEVPTQDLDWMPPQSSGQPRLQQRLDLVGLTEDGVLEIVELKVTSRADHNDVEDFPQVRAQLAAVRARLGDRDRRLRGRLLYVQADGSAHRWATFVDER